MTVVDNHRTDQVEQYVDPAVRTLLDRLDRGNRLIGGYQLGFWDADGAPTVATGKRLRPALALMSARAAGADPPAGVPAAAAVELAHNFSLLHDDVMDGDTQRRHRPTAWVVFGTGPAILAGDALLGLAYEALAEVPDGGPALRRLMRDVRRLIAGQAADLDFERREHVTLAECLAMAENKTASLLSGSCALGAMLGGGTPELVDGLARFASHLGMAFQLVDDVLGIWGDPERTGKPAGSDIRSRKRTIPVGWAMTTGGATGASLAELYRRSGPLTEDTIARAVELVEASGARAWTEQRARREADRARAALAGLALPGEVRREFTDIADFITGRDH